MGLFGNDKEGKAPQEEEKKVEEFVSIIVESDNIPREIKSISSAKNVPLSELDFKIIKVKTQIMTSREEGWQIADKETLDKLSDKDFLINPDLKIKQLYKVEIFKVDTNIETKILPQIILGANKLLTKVIVTIKKDVEVKYYSKLEHDIIEDINKRKISLTGLSTE